MSLQIKEDDMDELRELMTKEGRERYDKHMELFGKAPEIKNVLDAAYFGLISEEECVRRIREQTRLNRKINKICGFVGLPLFLIWTLFSICLFMQTGLQIVFVEGILVGIAGIVLSSMCLKRYLKKSKSL